MQCFIKQEDSSLIGVDNVETTYIDNGSFITAFISSISVVQLLSHAVQLNSPSSLMCSLLYPVGVISSLSLSLYLSFLHWFSTH